MVVLIGHKLCCLHNVQTGSPRVKASTQRIKLAKMQELSSNHVLTNYETKLNKNEFHLIQKA